MTLSAFACCAACDCFKVDSSFVRMSLGSGDADVITTVNSPLYLAYNPLKPSMTPSTSPNLPFSERTVNKFLVISDTGVFFEPEPSNLEKMIERPAMRSLEESVGLCRNAFNSGVSLTEVEIVFSSDWTWVRIWGDLVSAAE